MSEEVNAHQVLFVFRQLLTKCEKDVENGWSQPSEEVDIARRTLDKIDRQLLVQDRIRTGGE